MTAKGRETIYKERVFRSQLEAKWAAFFDLCRWKWEYEPKDLKYYIPDFILYFQVPILVEVKGIDSLDELRSFDVEKIERSGWKGEAILVGSTHFSLQNEPYRVLGNLLSIFDGKIVVDALAYAIECGECGALSFATHENGDACRVAGCQGSSFERHWREANRRFEANWTRAANEVRWNPKAR